MNNWITSSKVLRGCSNSIWERLNDDLLVLILDRVPYKSLCTFKCVSTHWYKLISLGPQHNRKKIMMHLRPPKPLLLCMTRSEIPMRISSINLEETLNDDKNHIVKLTPCLNHLSSLLNQWSVDILPCSIGELICLSTAQSKFYVCNPTTGQVVCLPEPSPWRKPHPSPCRTAGNAFGYIPMTSEYKVAHFYTEVDDEVGTIRCEIFTISNDKVIESCLWRGVEDVCRFPVQNKGVMTNGIFYWLTDEFDSMGRYRRPDVLFLDVFTKKFGVKLIPSEVSCQYSHTVKQVELEGQYCLVDPFAETESLIIWSLKSEHGDYSSDGKLVWEKIYNIRINVARWSYTLRACYVWDGVMVLRDLDRKGAIYCYNLDTGVVRVLSSEMSVDMEISLYASGSFTLITG